MVLSKGMEKNIKNRFGKEFVKLLRSLKRYDLVAKVIHRRVRAGQYPVSFLDVLKDKMKSL